jgi:hypothetical protein
MRSRLGLAADVELGLAEQAGTDARDLRGSDARGYESNGQEDDQAAALRREHRAQSPTREPPKIAAETRGRRDDETTEARSDDAY